MCVVSSCHLQEENTNYYQHARSHPGLASHTPLNTFRKQPAYLSLTSSTILDSTSTYRRSSRKYRDQVYLTHTVLRLRHKNMDSLASSYPSVMKALLSPVGTRVNDPSESIRSMYTLLMSEPSLAITSGNVSLLFTRFFLNRSRG